MITTEHLLPYLSGDNHSWIDYLNDDPGTDAFKDAMAKELFEETHTRFNAWLPEGFSWTPQTSSVVGPRDRFDEVPDADDIEAAMEQVKADIEARYEDIERRVRYRLAAAELPALPRPIKPRTLETAYTRGADFITNDGKYRISAYGSVTWNVERNYGTKDAPDWRLVMQTRGTLDDVRREYCTPANRMPWLVCDMDKKVLRIVHNRKAARDWAEQHAGAPLRSMTHAKDSTIWSYAFGFPGEDGNACFDVMRADNAHLHGYDPDEEPFFPYEADPHQEGPRGTVWYHFN